MRHAASRHSVSDEKARLPPTKRVNSFTLHPTALGLCSGEIPFSDSDSEEDLGVVRSSVTSCSGSDPSYGFCYVSASCNSPSVEEEIVCDTPPPDWQDSRRRSNE